MIHISKRLLEFCPDIVVLVSRSYGSSSTTGNGAYFNNGNGGKSPSSSSKDRSLVPLRDMSTNGNGHSGQKSKNSSNARPGHLRGANG